MERRRIKIHIVLRLSRQYFSDLFYFIFCFYIFSALTLSSKFSQFFFRTTGEWNSTACLCDTVRHCLLFSLQSTNLILLLTILLLLMDIFLSLHILKIDLVELQVHVLVMQVAYEMILGKLKLRLNVFLQILEASLRMAFSYFCYYKNATQS